MSEIGIDISDQTSKPLSDFNPQDYDAVISLWLWGELARRVGIKRSFQDWKRSRGQPLKPFAEFGAKLRTSGKLIQSLSGEQARRSSIPVEDVLGGGQGF